jgi:hypothetical protein
MRGKWAPVGPWLFYRSECGARSEEARKGMEVNIKDDADQSVKQQANGRCEKPY